MIEREYEELLHQVLDGTASPEQTASLEAWLAGSEAGRTRRRELEGVFQALHGIPWVEAPADLRVRVLQALRARAAPVATRAGWHAGVRRGLLGSGARLAYAFAAGLAAGVIGFGALTGLSTWPGGGPPVTGTMMPPRADPPVTAAIRRSWSSGTARVEAISWRTATTRMVVLQVWGRAETRIELEFDPRRLSLIGLRHAHPEGNRVEIGDGRVGILGQGRGEYTVEFEESADGGPPIRVTVRSGGATARGELPAGAAPGAAPSVGR